LYIAILDVSLRLVNQAFSIPTPDIDRPSVVIFVNENVGGLRIAPDNVSFMQLLNRFSDLAHPTVPY
jgi:hypothetical protein